MANHDPKPPPEEHRWKPGQSGNPAGTTKARRDVAALNKLIEELGAEPGIAKTWLTEAIGDRKNGRDPNFQFFRLLVEYRNGKPAEAPQESQADDGTKTLREFLADPDPPKKRKARKADPAG